MTDNIEKQHILHCALELGEASGWEALRLHDIADSLDISLFDIQQHFRQKDDLVETWFDRADQDMLQLDRAELHALEMEGRLHRIIFAWLDPLAEHRILTRQMLMYKLEPLHFHLQVQGVTRISRTVQWIMELSGMQTRHLKRVAVEAVLTTIYLATFARWLTDDSDNQERTREFLSHRLHCAGSLEKSVGWIIPGELNPRNANSVRIIPG